MLDAKAKDLADMVGEVSIKTVDASEFEENAVHQKNEVEEEGYMGGKVRQKLKTLFFFSCLTLVLLILIVYMAIQG